MEFALGHVVDGLAVGWEPASSEEQAIKVAYERSMTDSRVYCIMTGENADDENACIAFLVIGGEFYKPYDL